jgi:hypothetical protein
MKSNKFRNEERNRLRKDIDLRHRMNSVDEMRVFRGNVGF